jgi:hypothetical protein
MVKWLTDARCSEKTPTIRKCFMKAYLLGPMLQRQSACTSWQNTAVHALTVPEICDRRQRHRTVLVQLLLFTRLLARQWLRQQILREDRILLRFASPSTQQIRTPAPKFVGED